MVSRYYLVLLCWHFSIIYCATLFRSIVHAIWLEWQLSTFTLYNHAVHLILFFLSLFAPQERGLSAYPFIEICKGELIHYMCPLENQDSFFVPELLEKQTESVEETETDKDADGAHAGMTS